MSEQTEGEALVALRNEAILHTNAARLCDTDKLKAAALAYAEACGYRWINPADLQALDDTRFMSDLSHFEARDRICRKLLGFPAPDVEVVLIDGEDWERLKSARVLSSISSVHGIGQAEMMHAIDAINAKLEAIEAEVKPVNDRHRRTNSQPRDFDVEGVDVWPVDDTINAEDADFVRISKEDWERLKACREDTQFISRHLWDDAFDAINAKLEGGE